MQRNLCSSFSKWSSSILNSRYESLNCPRTVDTVHHLIWIWWLLAPKKWRWRWLKCKKTQGLRTASVSLNWFAAWSWSQIKSLRDCCMLSIFLYSLYVKPAGNDNSSGCSGLPVYPGTAVCVTSTGSILLKSSKVGNTYTHQMNS